MAKFLQWNINGINSHYEDLKLLVHDHKPKIVALQETLQSSFSFAGYNIYHKKENANARGISLMIENCLVSSEVVLQTNLEAIAARVTVCKKAYTFCNLYLSPSKAYSKASIENVLDQLPRPFVLMGDFNAHHPLWGSTSSSPRGDDLVDIFSLRNLCVINDGSNTFLRDYSNYTSCLDLTVVDPAIVLDFDWSVLDDAHGSDHFPIVLTSTSSEEEDKEERFNLNKANWPLFEDICRGRIKDESVFNEDTCSVESFTRILNDAVEDSIPKLNLKNRKVKVPWFNEECRAAKKRRKRALHRFRQAPTLANMLAFR